MSRTEPHSLLDLAAHNAAAIRRGHTPVHPADAFFLADAVAALVAWNHTDTDTVGSNRKSSLP